MDVLVLGGSVFLGRAMVSEAVAAGHRVTVFNRGRSGPVPDGAEHVPGDRTDPADLERLARRRFDLVIDTSGYVPAEVGHSAAALHGAAGHYAFVSSISVFPGWPDEADYQRKVHDGTPDATRDDVPDTVPDWQHYGWLKSGCERAVQDVWGDRCSVLRAGAIVGPHDSAVGRLPWWLARAARGGELLAPGGPDDPIALVDARDIARFALSDAPGTFELGGPAGRDTWGGFVSALLDATGGQADPVWVDASWLAQQVVEPWSEVPFWTGDPAAVQGTWRHDGTAAERAGMRWRPLAETVRDTAAWLQTWTEEHGEWQPTAMTPGLPAERERAILDAWERRTS